MANNIFKKKEISLDTFNDLNKEMITSFSQGDRLSDKLIIRLTNDGVPLDLTDVVQVRIDFRKTDGKLVFQYCTIEDRAQGLISCILTTQTLAAPGKVYAEVTAKYPEGKDAVTRQFTFWVQDAIAGDKSIESQNEWPMLERAIVAGDMLAGVDLVAIIKAGELAAAALPKAGGTMTGNLFMKGTSAISQRFGAGDTPTWAGWESLTDGTFRMMDFDRGRNIMSYDPVTDMLNINRGTNVVKKAGDTMTGNLLMANTTGNISQRFSAGATPVQVGWEALTDGKFRMFDWKNSRILLSYDPVADMIDISRNTNVVKKAEIYSDYLQPSGNTKVLSAATDLNTVQATGCYAGSAFVNAPEGLTSYMYIEVLRYSDVKYVKQVATILTGGSVPRVFVRRMNNNAWESWVESINSSGGTVSGDLKLDRAGATVRDILWSKDGVAQTNLGMNSVNKLRLYDNVNALTVFDYDTATKIFNIFQELSLPKGATVTGPLTLSGISSQLRIDDKGPSIRIDQPTDTATTSARGVTLYENNVLMGGFGRIRNGTFLDQMYMGWGANPWSESTSLTVSDTKFTYKNKPVAMRDKDGTVSLTLTSDATNANAGYLPIADRRGNTVTVRMEVTRNVGSASPLICTLPADVRPANTVSMNFLANDGSLVGVNITWDGKVEMYATGKQTKIVVTYAVN